MTFFASFVDPAGLAIVVGGTALSLVLRTSAPDLVRAVRALAVAGRRPMVAEPLLEQIAALTRIARRHGVVTLDRARISDPDVAEAIAAIVDGVPPTAIERQLDHARSARLERHAAAADVWGAVADVAPAMGMIGTLVGLVQMFVAMHDPAAIGGAMALALLTTLYGAGIASLVGLPLAARLRRLARAEAFERARLAAPLVELARSEAPRFRAEPVVAAA